MSPILAQLCYYTRGGLLLGTVLHCDFLPRNKPQGLIANQKSSPCASKYNNLSKWTAALALGSCTWFVRSEFGSLYFKLGELQFGFSSPYSTGPVRFRRSVRIMYRRKKGERPALHFFLDTGWIGIWRCIRPGGHSRIDIFVAFPSKIS